MLQDELKLITDEQTRREVTALSLAIREIEPELRVLSSKIETADSYCVGSEGPDRTKYMRGISLANKYQSTVTCKHTNTNAGELGGHCLVLTPTGQLIQLERSGYWSRWARTWNEWKASPRAMTLTTAIKEYGFGKIVANMIEAIEEKIDDKKPRQAKRLQARVKKIKRITNFKLPE